MPLRHDELEEVNAIVRDAVAGISKGSVEVKDVEKMIADSLKALEKNFDSKIAEAFKAIETKKTTKPK